MIISIISPWTRVAASTSALTFFPASALRVLGPRQRPTILVRMVEKVLDCCRLHPVTTHNKVLRVNQEINLLCWPVLLHSSQSRSTVKAFSVFVVVNWLTFTAVINVIIIIVRSSQLVICAVTHCMMAISLALTSTSLTLSSSLLTYALYNSGLITIDCCLCPSTRSQYLCHVRTAIQRQFVWQ